MPQATPAQRFLQLIQHKSKFKFFLLKKLPAAFFAGLQVKAVNQEACTVSVPYKWFTQNPFRSTYFACLSMAAEMSTGILAMAQVYKRQPSVSMLVVSVDSKYFKKGIGQTYFTCNDGSALQQAVAKAMETGEAQTVKAYSRGVNESGEMIAEFWITWSFKVKGKG